MRMRVRACVRSSDTPLPLAGGRSTLDRPPSREGYNSSSPSSSSHASPRMMSPALSAEADTDSPTTSQSPFLGGASKRKLGISGGPTSTNIVSGGGREYVVDDDEDESEEATLGRRPEIPMHAIRQTFVLERPPDAGGPDANTLRQHADSLAQTTSDTEQYLTTLISLHHKLTPLERDDKPASNTPAGAGEHRSSHGPAPPGDIADWARAGGQGIQQLGGVEGAAALGEADLAQASRSTALDLDADASGVGGRHAEARPQSRSAPSGGSVFVDGWDEGDLIARSSSVGSLLPMLTPDRTPAPQHSLSAGNPQVGAGADGRQCDGGWAGNDVGVPDSASRGRPPALAGSRSAVKPPLPSAKKRKKQGVDGAEEPARPRQAGISDFETVLLLCLCMRVWMTCVRVPVWVRVCASVCLSLNI